MLEFGDPIAAAFIGVVIAVPIMFIFIPSGSQQKLKWHAFRLSFNRYYFISGVLTSLAIVSFLTALQFIQVIYASVLASLEPVFTLLLISFFLKGDDTINKHLIIAIGIIFCGTALLIYG